MKFRTHEMIAASLFSLALLPSLPACASETSPEKPVGLTGTTDAVGLVDLAPHNLSWPVNDYDLRARTEAAEIWVVDLVPKKK